jgi:hypothetical protein
MYGGSVCLLHLVSGGKLFPICFSKTWLKRNIALLFPVPLIFYSAIPSNATTTAADLLTYGYQTASILLEKLTVAQPVENITAFY